MIVFPNCKINLGLRILRKRDDGYHDLETVFYPLPFTDVLEIITDRHPAPQENVRFSQSGLAVSGTEADNLCVKAYRLLKENYPDLPAVQMHLYKNIPMGAGLGGGSADAAFTLKLLNEQYKLEIPAETLLQYALKLGSDCPFFLLNQPCLATGRGEKMEPVATTLHNHQLILVNPGIHVPTAGAFAGIEPGIPDEQLTAIICEPVEHWKDRLINDFEKTVFRRFPEIGQIKQALYRAGALYAAMSGSGSSVYGIFSGVRELSLSFPPGWLVKNFRV